MFDEVSNHGAVNFGFLQGLQRTNEFGIRMALGAQKADVLKIVLASAGASVGLGIGSGLIVSFGLNRLIARWVENSSHNPSPILAGSILLLVVAIVACLAPARRALSVDPMTRSGVNDNCSRLIQTARRKCWRRILETW